MSNKVKKSGLGLIFLLLCLPALGWGQNSCDLNRADMNNDATVDASDLLDLLNCVFLGTGCGVLPRGDLNCDGLRTSWDVDLMLPAVFLGQCVPCGAVAPTTPHPADSIIIESKMIQPGADAGPTGDTSSYLYVRVFITNKDTLAHVTLPLEIRNTAGGAFAIAGYPRGFNGTMSRLTSTLGNGAVIAPKINSASPDSANWHGLDVLGDPSTAEPPNATRKALWDLKFDTVIAACGLISLDSIRIFDNTAGFLKLNGTALPVNFVKSTITVIQPVTDFNLRTRIQHFGDGNKGKWRWVRVRCENTGVTCPTPAVVTWNAPAAAENVFAYPRAYPVSGGASVAATVGNVSSTARSWNIFSVGPGEAFYLWARYKIPCGLSNGTPLINIARSEPVTGDPDTLDNTGGVTVFAAPGPGCPEPGEPASAFAPGDEAEKFASAPSVYIQAIDTLTYLITFRNNVGGTNASVTVRDTLDTELNQATFDSLGASHNYTFAVNGREVSWTFSGINLPDSLTDDAGSLGFAAFRILLENGVTEEDTVQNQAEVYFDSDPPLPTAGQQVLTVCSALPGDMDDSGGLPDATDVVLLLNCVFLGSGDCRNCFSDLDCDREKTPTDVIMLMNAAFLGDPLRCP